jgi:integrase
VLQYRPIGQRNAKRITLAAVDALSLDEARREARKLLAKALTGTDPHAEKAAAKAQAAETLGAVADVYLRHCEKHQKPGTFYQTKLHLTKHWAPLRPLPFRKVRRADVAARLNQLRETSGGVSANRSRSALSAMFAWAIGEGLTDLNPVVGTHKPAKEAPRERVLTDSELAAIWGACRDDAYGRIVRLLMLTAQRREEVGGITDAELDLNRALWSLPAARSKNKREHIIPLSQPAVAILRDAPRLVGREFVFGEGAGGFSGWSRAKAALDARLKAAGTPLAPWTLHDLRRTAATVMADRLGVLPHVIEAVLNHVSGHKAGVAGTYNRATYASEKRDALDRWAQFLTDASSACG